MFIGSVKKSLGSLAVGTIILLVLIWVGWRWLDSSPVTKEQGAEPMVSNQPLAGAQDQSYQAEQVPTLRPDDKILNDFGQTEPNLAIFVFEDYSNPFSAVLADDLEKVRLSFGNAVTIVVRPYAENGGLAVQAAAAVECAAKQDKWREMRALLFSRLKNRQLFEINVPEYADQIGLAAEKWADCLTQMQKSGTIEQLAAEARQHQVYGTPALFIGSDFIPGARPFSDYVDNDGQSVAGLETIISKKLGLDLSQVGDD